MKVLHVLTPSSRMMRTFVDTIQEAFPHDSHIFYTIKNIPRGEQDFFEPDNMVHMEGSTRYEKMLHLKKACDSVDVVVWHGFLYPFRLMLFLYGNRKILAKSVWIMWGIDLYNWKLKGLSPQVIFMNHVNKVCRKKIKVAVALLEPDIDVYRSQFGNRAKVVVAPYPISYSSFEMMNQRRNSECRTNGIVNLQIGNNAHSFNNHHRVLDSIANKDSDNMRYFIPLSYGDKRDWRGNAAGYVTALVSRANTLFGDRVHYLRRLMPQEEYTDYLWSIDIAVFDADRQNALGNILKLLYMGSSVYLSPKNPLYGYFKELGIEVRDASAIASMSCDEFFKEPDPTSAVQWINETYYPPNAIARWGEVLDMFRGNHESVKSALKFEEFEVLNFRHFKQKPDFYSTAPYASKKRFLPKDWRYAVLAGDENVIHIVADSILESEPYWYLTGTVHCAGNECDYGVTHPALGRYSDMDEYGMYSNRVFMLPAFRDGTRRKDFIEKLVLPESPVYFASKGCHIGVGCKIGHMSIITSGSHVMPSVDIGHGVLICKATIGVKTVIEDYVTIMPGSIIGAYCKIGKGSLIEQGVFVPEGTEIEAGSVLTASE